MATWICLDIAHSYEEQCQPPSGSAWLDDPKMGKSGPQCWERGYQHNVRASVRQTRCDSSTACSLYSSEFHLKLLRHIATKKANIAKYEVCNACSVCYAIDFEAWLLITCSPRMDIPHSSLSDGDFFVYNSF